MLVLRQMHRAPLSSFLAGRLRLGICAPLLLASDAPLRTARVRRRQASQRTFVLALRCYRVSRFLPLRFRWQVFVASVRRRVRFVFASLGLRVARLSVSGSRVVLGVAACGSPASVVTSALTIRPSRRRFAARLNSGVRPGKKHSNAGASAVASRSAFSHFCWVGVGQWFARCASRFGRIASGSAGAPPPSV